MKVYVPQNDATFTFITFFAGAWCTIPSEGGKIVFTRTFVMALKLTPDILQVMTVLLP